MWKRGKRHNVWHSIFWASIVRCIYSLISHCTDNRNFPSSLLIIWTISHPKVSALNHFTQTLTGKSSQLSFLWVLLLAYWSILSLFKVEGQGFKVDAARLTAHSSFLWEMLFDSNGLLGISKEGTVDNPIIVQGCTVETFANFLGWLNCYDFRWWGNCQQS